MGDLLQVVHNDDARTVRLIGELDASNAEALLDDLGPKLGEGSTLTLDLTELSFVDSMGLRSILRAAAALGTGGRLILYGPQRPVARTFELVGLEKVANIQVARGTEA